MLQQVADGFIDDFYRDALKPAKNNMRLMEIFMLLAVVISLLGLIAMSTYYAGENAKGIAVQGQDKPVLTHPPAARHWK